MYERITPAYAGKSTHQPPSGRGTRDHPRVCGEKLSTTSTDIHPAGSPPRVRGKVSAGKILLHDGGITPACAGKSLARSCLPGCLRDHPRVCGEKLFQSPLLRLPLGSPPRVRGKVSHVQVLQFWAGITPACAGKSVYSYGAEGVGRDHPRMCGEKQAQMDCIQLSLGSPPRVRGKVLCYPLNNQIAGITPACAGKSSIQHLTASLGEFEVQKGHPVPHLRQRLQVWPDHARHLRHGLILHASRSAGQGHRPCRAPCPDTAGSGTPRGPSPAKRPHTSPPAATPGGCRAWQSGATAPGSR